MFAFHSIIFNRLLDDASKKNDRAARCDLQSKFLTIVYCKVYRKIRMLKKCWASTVTFIEFFSPCGFKGASTHHYIPAE